MMLELSRVFGRQLAGVDLSLSSGVHVILGTVADGLTEIVEMVAGLSKPTSGRVRVAQGTPFDNPEIRRRIAALLGDERLPPGRTVAESVSLSLEARADPSSPDELLGRFGLSSWAERAPASLGSDERRSVAAAIALGHWAASVLILMDPLGSLRGIERGHIIEAVQAAVERETLVLVATPTARDAIDFGGVTYVLERGRITRSLTAAQIDSLLPGSPVELVVHASDVRSLAARLAEEPDVFKVDYDLQQSPGRLVVQGPDPSSTALSLSRASRQAGVSLFAVTPATPPLEVVRAANTALMRAAYDHAYRAHSSSRAAAHESTTRRSS